MISIIDSIHRVEILLRWQMEIGKEYHFLEIFRNLWNRGIGKIEAALKRKMTWEKILQVIMTLRGRYKLGINTIFYIF